jgi:hypothetical protein
LCSHHPIRARSLRTKVRLRKRAIQHDAEESRHHQSGFKSHRLVLRHCSSLWIGVPDTFRHSGNATETALGARVRGLNHQGDRSVRRKVELQGLHHHRRRHHYQLTHLTWPLPHSSHVCVLETTQLRNWKDWKLLSLLLRRKHGGH